MGTQEGREATHRQKGCRKGGQAGVGSHCRSCHVIWWPLGPCGHGAPEMWPVQLGTRMLN